MEDARPGAPEAGAAALVEVCRRAPAADGDGDGPPSDDVSRADAPLEAGGAAVEVCRWQAPTAAASSGSCGAGGGGGGGPCRALPGGDAVADALAALDPSVAAWVREHSGGVVAGLEALRRYYGDDAAPPGAPPCPGAAAAAGRSRRVR